LISRAVDSIFASHCLNSPCIIHYNTFATSIGLTQPGSEKLGFWGYFWFSDKFRPETRFFKAVRSQGMSDMISSEDSSSIDFDRGSSCYYKTIAELQGKRYREAGLTNEDSGSRAQNAGSSTRLVSIYTRNYCVKPTPKFPEFDRAKSPLFPEFAPGTAHPSLPKIQR